MKLSEGLKKKANKLKIKSVQLNLSILKIPANSEEERMHQVFCFHKLYCITTSSNILKDSILTSTCTNKASRVELIFLFLKQKYMYIYSATLKVKRKCPFLLLGTVFMNMFN